MDTIMKLVGAVVIACMLFITYTTCEVITKDVLSIPILSDGRVVFPPSIDTGDAAFYLKALQEERDYHIIIDCFGGGAHDTIAIINRIAELQSKGFTITTEAYGYTMSGGAFIFIMGDTRIIHEGASLMFHGAGYTGTYGTRHSLRKYILTGRTTLSPDVLKSLSLIDDKFTRELRKQTKMTLEDMYAWLYEYDYNYMSSEEALKLGVATEER